MKLEKILSKEYQLIILPFKIKNSIASLGVLRLLVII